MDHPHLRTAHGAVRRSAVAVSAKGSAGKASVTAGEAGFPQPLAARVRERRFGTDSLLRRRNGGAAAAVLSDMVLRAHRPRSCAPALPRTGAAGARGGVVDGIGARPQGFPASGFAGSVWSRS